MEVRGELVANFVSLKAGDVTASPLSRKAVPPSGRATTDSFILRFPAASFPSL